MICFDARKTGLKFSRFLVVFGLLLGAGDFLEAQTPESAGSPFILRDLRAVLDTGVVLQDRNGDGVVDHLSLKILFPPQATEAEVAAAGNVAARFGYETSGSDLGLGGHADPRTVHKTPVVLVGGRALEASGMPEAAAELMVGLAPGQGVMAYISPVGPFEAGAVALVGYDASGLLAVSDYFAGRVPEVWEPGGITWQKVVEELDRFLAQEGSEGARTFLDRMVLDRAVPGVPRAQIVVEVPTSDAFSRALDALSGRGAGEDQDTVAVSPGDVAPIAITADTERGEGGEAQEPLSLEDLEFRALHRLDVRVVSSGEARTVTLRPSEPWRLQQPAPFQRSSEAPFSLSALYEVGGLYRDTNRDLVPDETTALISLGDSRADGSLLDFATRVGLETAGIRLPLVTLDAQENDPSVNGFPVLVGTEHYQIQRLREEDKLPGADSGPGEGFVQLVEGAFGERNAMAVGGQDEAGLASALDWLSQRVPYLWTYGKGEYRLAEVETEVRRFLQGRKAPGQVALALTKLESWMDRMTANPPSRVQVEIAADTVPPGVASLAEEVVRERFPASDISAETWSTGFGVGDTVFVKEWEIPWEVDEVRRLLDQRVYPAVRSGAPAEVEIRVSEPPEIREAFREEIRATLLAGGASTAEVRVLSAYKQGYSWIHDVLLPQLRDRGVASVDLTYHTLEESDEVRWQTIAAETRWLQEVYPIDAVLSRELGIPDSVVQFHPTRRRDPIYTFEARDASGEVILRDTFDPRYVVRPFFDLFPEYEQVRVTTGWIEATSGGELTLDQRVVTDPERFWDRLQTEAYGAIIDYVMDIQDGDPSGDNAPFFDEFRVDLRLSEPDYRIGVDEETISSLEALHEDLYFETHTLFTLLGGRYQTALSNPGRVLPFVDPSGAGLPGTARLVLTGKKRGNPRLTVRTWPDESSPPRVQEYELDPLPLEPPRLVGATLADGLQGLRQLMVRVTLPDSVDRYQEFAARSDEAGIDREFLSVELMEGMLRSLERLHGAGLMEEVLSLDRVDQLAIDFRLEKDSTFQRTRVLKRSRNPRSTQTPHLGADGWSYTGDPMVRWDSPISVEEDENLLAKLGTFPGVDVYYLTNSYLGHQVWAADFLPPDQAAFVSQAKLNALKPTLFVSGREHANEVSSTSHILRLGELLVTDSAYKEMLKKVNVVLHPVTNPDGAALAYARQLVNPDHMLHAGRPGALGTDATSGGNSDDPVYPEAKARQMIREAWLPDIYLNPHGYPSHEWVQYFAGYSAWARGRRVGPRTWWVPRGWFIPSFSWVEDEENPEYQQAQFAILDSMAMAVTGNPEVDAMNRRLYARYKKYGEQEREGFTEYFHKGMVLNMRLRGSEDIGTGLNSPRITYFSITTEAPDETARGVWMDLMGQVGLAHTTSALRYLANGRYEVKREMEASGGAVVRKVFRVKPVLPPDGG